MTTKDIGKHLTFTLPRYVRHSMINCVSVGVQVS